MEIALCLPHPTDMPAIARQLAPSSFGLFWSFGGSAMRRAVWTAAGPAALRFTWQGDRLTVSCDGIRDPEYLAALARSILSLDHPLGEIERELRAHPRLSDLAERHSGLRIVQAADLWEALVTAVAGQQVSVAAATGVRRRLLAEGPASPEGLRLYPPVEQAAAYTLEKWREMGFSRQKSAYLSALAAELRDGIVSRADFGSRAAAAARKREGHLLGVGPWTVDIVRMRLLGARDVWPDGDLGLQEGLRRVLGLSARPDAAAAAQFGEGLGDLRSTVCFHLWADLGAGG